MNSIAYHQIFILLLQTVIVAGLILTLFRIRTIFGLGPLFTALGVFQFFQVFLTSAFYFEVANGIFVSPGNIIFTGGLFAILLIYVREDALEARKVIYAILAANLVMSFMLTVISWGIDNEGIKNIYNFPKEFFTQDSMVTIVETLALLIDVFVIIFLYETVSKYVSQLFLRFFFSMLLVLTLDTLLFSFGIFIGTGRFLDTIYDSIISKYSAVLVFSLIFSFYLQHYEKLIRRSESKDDSFKDLFYKLTFRQKYEQVSSKNVQLYEQIKENEIQFQSIFEQARDGIVIFSKDKKLLLANAELIRLSGYSKVALLSLKLSDIFKEASLEESKERIRSLLREEIIKPFEARLLTKKGQLIPVEISISMLKNLYGLEVVFQGIVRDITERKKADEALKKSEENLRLSTELANVAVWEYNFNTDSMSRSKNHDQLYGLPPQERWKMDTFLDATHPLDREISSGFIQKSVASGGPDNYSFDFRVVFPNKTIHWLNVIGQVVERNSKGEGVIVRGTLMDITERKNLTEAIKRNERVLQLFVKYSPAAIAMFDKEMNYIVASDRYKLDYRLGETAITGRSHYEIFPEITAEWKEIHQRCLSGEIIKNEEDSFLRADGTLDWVRWEIHPWYEQPDKIGGIILFSEVITERKQAEEALKENYALLKIAGKTAKFGGWNVNLNENRVYWSDEVAAIHEMPAGYVPPVEEGFLFYAPEWRNKITEVFTNCAQNGISYDEEMEIITSKGNRIWVRTIGEAVRDNKGKIVKVQGAFQDITVRKQVEENLRLTNQTIKNILDFSQTLIYIFDLNGKFLLANKNYEKLLGTTQEELLGQTREKYFPKEIAEQHRKNDLIVIDSKESVFFEEENMEADGKHFYLTSKFPLFDTKGEIYAVGGISTDITERKLASEEIYSANRELQMLNNTILTLVSGLDLDKTLNKILQTALEVIGLEGGTICLINPDNTFNLVVERGASKEIIEDFTNNKVKIGECLCGNCALDCKPLILNTKEDVLKYASREAHWGDDIHFHAAFPFVIDKKSIGVLCVFTRTETKPSLKNLKLLETIVSQTAIFIDNMLLYKEIDHQNTNLEKIVAQRTQQLEYTNSELRDFAQVVSHDLKAPLRAISQLSYWLYKDYADKIDQAGQNQLSLIISRTKRLDDLIDGILQYSKAGKQLEKQQEIDLNALLKRCIKALNPPEHIQIKIDNKLPFYTADETRMVQLFQNLIDNAIKYNDKPKGEIHIGCKTKDGFYEFYISDNGFGIEENYFERIFQIFQRVESRDYQEGTGIGLSLVKRIVLIYGGEVKLTSKVGKGSIFYVTLPIINNIT